MARITTTEREKAKMSYITTNISLRDLSTESGISVSALQGYSKKEDWLKLRQSYQESLEIMTLEKVQDKMSDELAEGDKKFAEIAKNSANKIQLMLLKAEKPSDVRQLIAALKDAQSIVRTSYGLDKIQTSNIEEIQNAINVFNNLTSANEDEVADLYKDDE